MICHGRECSFDEDAVVVAKLLRLCRRGGERLVELREKRVDLGRRCIAHELRHPRILLDVSVFHSQVDEDFLPPLFELPDVLRELRLGFIHGLQGFQVNEDERLVLFLAQLNEALVALVERIEYLEEFLPSSHLRCHDAAPLK